MGTSLKSTTVANIILLLTSIWLISAPFVLHYTTLAGKNNDIYTGIGLGLLALIGIFFNKVATNVIAWISGVVGLWEISAPFVLVYSTDTSAMISSLVVGALIVIVSLWQILSVTEESEIITRHFDPEFGFGRSYTSTLKRPRKTPNKTSAEK